MLLSLWREAMRFDSLADLNHLECQVELADSTRCITRECGVMEASGSAVSLGLPGSRLPYLPTVEWVRVSEELS